MKEKPYNQPSTKEVVKKHCFKIKKEFREQVKQLVEYMTDLNDTDVIENYTDTIMLACEEYCELVTNKNENNKKNRRSVKRMFQKIIQSINTISRL